MKFNIWDSGIILPETKKDHLQISLLAIVNLYNDLHNTFGPISLIFHHGEKAFMG